MNDPISESLKVLVEYFNSRNVPYVIVGGVSVLILGRARLTMDIDIIVDHTKLDREDFVNFLKSNNFDATLNDFEEFDEQTHCSIYYKEGMEIINREELKEKAKEMSVSDKLESFLNEVESFLKEKGEIF
ncbi:MAG: hypothetical protein K9W46_05785 [Candidatus Heimdallarchaeum endolithica]|uniref:Nucleotidyltransferase n=1 Tax=Candidatus Heimdallarchaeum endolithica TaxID=2876572 RepID=A0A9Y1BVA1_9ARCH|nr:MAG: hypothetical protein K9W46_05785 [Candidatus Heimdallarchaeum endolithica]